MTSIVRIDTEFGSIRVALDDDAAPITATNFLHYVDDGLYDGGTFHRTVREENQSNVNLALREEMPSAASLPNDEIEIQVIQGTINSSRESEIDEAIPLERTSDTGLRHRDGTVSMARTTPDSADVDFFICIDDQPELDFGGQRNPDGQGFAAFGQVIDGMDTVRTIQSQPARGQTFDPAIKIVRIIRED